MSPNLIEKIAQKYAVGLEASRITPLEKGV